MRFWIMMCGIALVVGLSWIDSAWAGAWVQPVGGTYLKFSYLDLEADSRIGCEGLDEGADPFGGTYRDQQIYIYGEWGAHEKVTVIGGFAFKDQTILGATIPDYGTRSTGDLRVGTRFGILGGSKPVAIEASFSIPTYPSTDPKMPVSLREQFLPAGSGHVETEIHALAGLSLFPLPLYANLDLGRRQRGGDFGDQWIVAAEVGGSSARTFVKTELRGIWPTGDPCAFSSAGAVAIHERSLRLGPEAAIHVGQGVWVGASASVLLQGRNTLDGTQWGLSISWQRR